MTDTAYLIAADLLLMLHVLVVLFVVLGQLLIMFGAWRGWQWVRHGGFRFFHLLAILVVALQAWLGRLCPLTVWEMALREKAGEVSYGGSFIAYWLGQLIYYQAPSWVFTLIYSLFALLVLLSWFYVKPKR
ncbi:DUF2784 domain-containing protein [Aliiglaciecola sp. CAU 1673]|uniref:DUF2784 domain-containing protein n=1 Tax=Aliiglaciecola sp. CAU 1673 TaxID=3032595 RepID=UPI0023DA3794|nr:DUF2784 domain-containing protein [Aliiglaciecola sp. CAU 1673]MDF2176956.1 DUF2784 domain-containing protein [Aliiglaciecola sp. CAU 1673]